MKLKYNFVVRTVGSQTVAVAVGQDNALFNGMVKLNQSGEFLFDMLNKGDVSQEEMSDALMAEYGIEKLLADETVSSFVEHLKTNGLIEE